MEYDVICEGLKKVYHTAEGNIEVLKGIDLKVPGGSAVTIIGPSGSGKTTLLNIIGTIESPDEGKVIVKGKDMGTLADDELAEFWNRSIGMVFQNDIFIESLPLIENILLPLSTRIKMDNRSKEKLGKKAEDLLTEIGLGGRLWSMPSQLSGGEARRASLIRAIITDPEIVLLDEPTASVDRENKSKILKLIEKMKGDSTILITTHDPELVKIADEAYSMNYGVLSPVP